MLGGVLVDHREALLEVVDQHVRDSGSASAVSTRSRWLVSGTWRASSASTASSRRGAVGDQQAGRVGVVLGLGDQVGRDERRVGAVSSARMPISVGPASESIPMTPLSSRLAAVT